MVMSECLISCGDIENRFMLRGVGQHPVQLSSHSHILSQGDRASDVPSSVTCCHLWLSLSQMKWDKGELSDDVGRLV